MFQRIGLWLVVALSALVVGCSRAPANVQTLVSDDCGKEWRLIPVGQTVPAGTGNLCFMKITVPNYPMVGESTFRAVFANRVRVSVNSSYTYTIIDPLMFIRHARFVTQQGSAGDSPKNGATVWDMAEDVVIDRLMRDVANSKDFLLAEDIVDFNQGAFEDRLQDELNKQLKKRGVQLDTFTFVVTPDDQTRNMIDLAAALRVCAAVQGLTSDSCQRIVVARAGATRVTVNTTKGGDAN
jgi:hypothetical protein